MPKYEQNLTGRFDDLLDVLDHAAKGNPSVSLSEQSDATIGDIRMALRVYQRLSVVAGNRLTLTVSLLGEKSALFLCAICTGGHGLSLGKLKILGEEEFLHSIKRACKAYIADGENSADDQGLVLNEKGGDMSPAEGSR